jgi:transcriptional regulator GlxA family with amidase domain
VAEQVSRRGEIEEHDTGQGERDDAVWRRWHEINDTCLLCHLSRACSNARIFGMSATLPLTEVLFFDGFDDLDAVAPFEVLSAAGFPVRPVRQSGASASVRSAHGLAISVTGELGSSSPQLVIVPGGGWGDGAPDGVRAQAAGTLPDELAALHAHGAVLAAVCTGAMLLAVAGLLRGRPAVTHRVALEDLAAAGADVRSDARVVDDGDLVTCGGVSSGLDLAVHLVGRFRGERAAAIAAARLEHAPVGPVLTRSPR